ncbi:helix-turn-helix domain-containing protein [Oscillochloris sp. ZM17-4]|uniref:ArsR/SmtB family transcription factor n=1 Tax=Oscillochloris sp. ZM17-4 TaxID=2866714 RepID=UPI001C733C75|nr:metalloregulator ArsR/SmtB family transcription factor [Oscillochloris sp. ZM17-4]MBX0328874.1 helix-turn-helix domain-containing protein [Oscillochloris sp. ZM17-4]
MMTAHSDPNPDNQHLAMVCKALGNPVRVQILRYIQRHPNCIGNEILLHMPDGGPHAQSTISQHLRVLREVGLLESFCDGAAVCYRVNEERLSWLSAQLSQL